MKERISTIAKFHKTDRGFALAVFLFAGLALVTLTDAQNGGNAARLEKAETGCNPQPTTSGIYSKS